MKKIYSSSRRKAIVFSLSLSLLSVMAFSQPICGPIVENFNNTSGSTVGFTGDFALGTTGPNSYLVKTNTQASGIYTITTPTYQLAASTSFLGYGFLLEGSERVARVEAAVVYVSTLTGTVTTALLETIIPTYSNTLPSSSTICRAISLTDIPGFPAGSKYRLRLEFTSNTGAGFLNQTINFDDFRTNGTLSLAPLPVTFMGVEAKRTQSGVQLTWKVAGEENINRYEVERSIDGRTYTSINSMAKKGKDTYSYLDATTAATITYYRIKNVDNDGKFKYSNVIRYTNGKSLLVLKAFPLPVAATLTVQHAAMQRNTGLITLSSADGRLMKTIRPSAGSIETPVNMTGVKAGLYLLRVDSGDGNVETMKVIKQ